MIEPAHPQISIARQCDLVGLPRSTYYYQAQGESAENLTLMRLLDKQYTDTPYYGVRRMTAWLRSQGYAVNHKRVARLLRTMGLETIYPKPRLSEPHPAHRVYPYLLAWGADHAGEPSLEYGHHLYSAPWWVYLPGGGDGLVQSVCPLVGGVDHDGRGLLSGGVRPSLEVARPEIFNSDQGAQFTSLDFTGRLAAAGIQISMDGRGRALDNVFVERLWRTVKYEEVYLKDYETPREAMQGLGTFFVRYNEWRQHQALGYQTPASVYFGSYL